MLAELINSNSTKLHRAYIYCCKIFSTVEILHGTKYKFILAELIKSRDNTVHAVVCGFPCII